MLWEPSDLWEQTGEDVWTEAYGHLRAVNFGISGDETGHLLWRVENASWNVASPHVAVVMIGTNNVTMGHEASEIAEGIGLVVSALRERAPGTRVLLGIFPRERTAGPLRAKAAEVNRRFTALDDGEWVHYRDLWDAFLDEEAAIPAEYMPDFLHLGPGGFRVWAREIEGELERLLALSDERKSP